MKINPHNMPPRQQHILSEFIKQNPHQTIIKKNTNYNIHFAKLNNIVNVKIKFSLTHTVLKRERVARNPEKVGVRFEIKSNEILGKGRFGTVYKTHTLVLDEDKNIFSSTTKQKPRIVKIQKSKAGRNESVLNEKVPHLRSKKIIFNGEKKGDNFYTAAVAAQMPGKNLTDILKTEKLTTEKKLQLFLALLKAVKVQVHENGLVHRDIKPDNIMVYFKPGSYIPEVNIIDFGLAKLKEENDIGIYCGSFFYMAPEVMQRRGSSPASDLYSLSKIFCEVFSKRDSLFTKKELSYANFLLNKLKQGPLISTAVEWIAGLWVGNPSLLFKHSNLSSLHNLRLKNIIRGMSCVDPADRISLDSAIERLGSICKQRAEALMRRKAEIQVQKIEKIKELQFQLLDLKKKLPVYYVFSRYPVIFGIDKVVIESDEVKIKLLLSKLDMKKSKLDMADLDRIKREIEQINYAWNAMKQRNCSNNFDTIFNALMQHFYPINTNESKITEGIPEALTIRKKINYIKTHMTEFINPQRNNVSRFFSNSCRSTLRNMNTYIPNTHLIRC